MTDNNQTETLHLAPRFVSVKHIPALYPAFSEASIRHFIYHSETNGFSECLKKVGRRVIIDRDEFEKWLKEHPYKNNSKGA